MQLNASKRLSHSISWSPTLDSDMVSIVVISWGQPQKLACVKAPITITTAETINHITIQCRLQSPTDTPHAQDWTFGARMFADRKIAKDYMILRLTTAIPPNSTILQF